MTWLAFALALAVAQESRLQSPGPPPVPGAERTWRFLSEMTIDTAVLQSKLFAAQTALKRGDPLYFELLAGAPAAYKATKLAPRKVFLNSSFAHPIGLLIRPQPHEFKMEFREQGSDLVLDVTVFLDFYGELQRVELLQRPPHPF